MACYPKQTASEIMALPQSSKDSEDTPWAHGAASGLPGLVRHPEYWSLVVDAIQLLLGLFLSFFVETGSLLLTWN